MALGLGSVGLVIHAVPYFGRCSGLGFHVSRVSVSRCQTGLKKTCRCLMYSVWPVVGEALAEIGDLWGAWRVLMRELLYRELRLE